MRLDTLHLENLEIVADSFDAGPIDAESLAKAWEKLDPWPDVVTGLTALWDKGLIATCSNGSIGMMARLARWGGLPWDALVGADVAKDYKPKPEVYLASARALGLAPGQVTMVAAHNDDLYAARDAGLRTAFVPRPTEHGAGQVTDLEAASDWDIVARDFVDLAAKA